MRILLGMAAAGLIGVPAAAAERLEGWLIAREACEAFQSKNKQTNPGEVTTEPMRAYAMLAINAPGGDFFQVTVPGAPVTEARWVHVGCGVHVVEAGTPVAPLPVELVDRGNEIEVRAEVYDTVRTIHMDRSAPPAGTAPSILGYSVGKWDDGALVVKTTLIDWPYFDSIGTPQSKDVAIEERYTLSADQTRLDYHLTITDPVNLAGTAVVDSHWLALGATLQRFDCRAERP